MDLCEGTTRNRHATNFIMTMYNFIKSQLCYIFCFYIFFLDFVFTRKLWDTLLLFPSSSVQQFYTNFEVFQLNSSVAWLQNLLLCGEFHRFHYLLFCKVESLEVHMHTSVNKIFCELICNAHLHLKTFPINWWNIYSESKQWQTIKSDPQSSYSNEWSQY